LNINVLKEMTHGVFKNPWCIFIG